MLDIYFILTDLASLNKYKCTLSQDSDPRVEGGDDDDDDDGDLKD